MASFRRGATGDHRDSDPDERLVFDDRRRTDEGKAEQAKGRVEQAQGDLTGDKSKKAEGVLDEAKGKTREAVDEAREAIHEATAPDKYRHGSAPDLERSGADSLAATPGRAYTPGRLRMPDHTTIAVGDRVCTKEGSQPGVVVRIQTLAAGVTSCTLYHSMPCRLRAVRRSIWKTSNWSNDSCSPSEKLTRRAGEDGGSGAR